MSRFQPLPPTGKACELELSFSFGRLSVSACFQFLQGSAMCSFHLNAGESPTLTQVNSSQPPSPPPLGIGENVSSMYLPPVLSRGVAIIPPAAIDYGFPLKQIMCHAHLAGLQIHSTRKGSALLYYRIQQSEIQCPGILWWV
jgi:hypothetical protein